MAISKIKVGNTEHEIEAKNLTATALPSSSSSTTVIWHVFDVEATGQYGGISGTYNIFDTEGNFNGLLSVRFRNYNSATAPQTGATLIKWLAYNTTDAPTITVTYEVNSASVTYHVYMQYPKTYRVLNITKISESIYRGTLTLVNAKVTAMVGTELGTSSASLSGSTANADYAKHLQNSYITITSDSSVDIGRGASSSLSFLKGGVVHAVFDGNGNFYSKENNAHNLGGSSYKWKAVYATNFYGNATSATKATQDGNGNNIADTYAKKGYELLVSGANSASQPELDWSDIDGRELLVVLRSSADAGDATTFSTSVVFVHSDFPVDAGNGIPWICGSPIYANVNGTASSVYPCIIYNGTTATLRFRSSNFGYWADGDISGYVSIYARTI